MTKLQCAILEAVYDWKAPYEVANMVGIHSATSQLQILLEAGYVEHAESQNTYRITDDGRAAIAEQ